MKIRSLLLAASAVALTATSANALVVTTATAPLNSGDILASELDLATAPVAGLYSFGVQAGSAATPANFPTGTPITVVITLPAGRVFGTGAAPTLSAAGGNNGQITAGGTAGSSSITFDITLATGSAINTLDVAGLPVNATSAIATGAAMNVSATANGVLIDGAAANDTSVFVPSASAFAGLTVTADGTPSTIGLGTNPTSGTPGMGFNLLADPALGTVAVTLATPAPNVTLLDNTGAAIPSAFAASDVTSTTTTLDFPASVAGFMSVSVNSVAGMASGNTVTSTSAGITVGPVSAVGLDNNASASIIAQTPTVTSVASALGRTGSTFTSPLTLTSGTATSPNLALETLVRDGASDGLFQWVGESGTISVFRITGLTPGATQTYNVGFANSTTGKNGTFAGSGTVTPGGELILNSANALGTTNAGYRRADVLISVDGTGVTYSPSTLDIDRQLIRNDIVSSFTGDLPSVAD